VTTETPRSLLRADAGRRRRQGRGPRRGL